MNLLEKYDYSPDSAEIDHAIKIITQNLDIFYNEEVLKNCFSYMDLTSLKNEDTPEKITAFVGKLAKFSTAYPDFPLPASVCVYPNLVSNVCACRISPEVHATAVAGCFPTSQSFPEVKLMEIRMAVEAGADEIDIVLALNKFLGGKYEEAAKEISDARATIDEVSAGRHVCLKVILETGILTTSDAIANASFLAMEAGADFIKTSTGKVTVNATLAAAYVMCQCIKKYYAATGRKVGFKPAGGISSAEDALAYYAIVSTVLGPEWLDKSLFRFGVSRLANSILSAVKGKTVKFF